MAIYVSNDFRGVEDVFTDIDLIKNEISSLIIIYRSDDGGFGFDAGDVLSDIVSAMGGAIACIGYNDDSSLIKLQPNISHIRWHLWMGTYCLVGFSHLQEMLEGLVQFNRYSKQAALAERYGKKMKVQQKPTLAKIFCSPRTINSKELLDNLDNGDSVFVWRFSDFGICLYCLSRKGVKREPDVIDILEDISSSVIYLDDLDKIRT